MSLSAQCVTGSLLSFNFIHCADIALVVDISMCPVSLWIRVSEIYIEVCAAFERKKDIDPTGQDVVTVIRVEVSVCQRQIRATSAVRIQLKRNEAAIVENE